MALTKRGLGRGLSALIPDQDMEFLSRVARGDSSITAQPVVAVPASKPSNEVKEPGTRHKRHKSEGALEDSPPEVSVSENSVSEGPNNSSVSESGVPVQWIRIEDVEANPFQPRRTFQEEEMRDLVASVREHGILQPILVRPMATSAMPGETPRFQLVAGERRWRAAREAGLSQVPAVVRQVADQQALELALIENVQRHDISPLDAALAYKRLASEFKLSQEEIARRVGKSRPAVANTLRLLDLPQEARDALEDGSLSEGHGRAILLASGEGARRAVFRRIVRDKLTVRETESLARASAERPEIGTATVLNANSAFGSSSNSSPSSSPAAARSVQTQSDYREAERLLQKRLGARLSIRPRAKGGSIVLEYSDERDLQRLIELLKPGG